LIVVYWLSGTEPTARTFEETELLSSLKYMEELRVRQRAGEQVSYITSCCAFSDSVGHPGVDVTGPSYDWKKRRV